MDRTEGVGSRPLDAAMKGFGKNWRVTYSHEETSMIGLHPEDCQNTENSEPSMGDTRRKSARHRGGEKSLPGGIKRRKLILYLIQEPKGRVTGPSEAARRGRGGEVSLTEKRGEERRCCDGA